MCSSLRSSAAKRFCEHQDGIAQIQLKRVLLATNFRPSSVAATHLATQIANQLGAELHVVYVIGDYFEQISVIFPEGGLAAITRLRSHVQERLAQLTRTGGAVAATHIAEGRPYQEIVKLAETLQADLVVIGTAVHGSLFGSSQVLGSEIERVIRNAPCPVLCVPAARAVTPLPALVTQIVPQTNFEPRIRPTSSRSGLCSCCHKLNPPKQSCCVIETFCFESDHRTGGRMFGLSRTVSDNCLVTRQVIYVVQNLAGGNQTRAGNVALVEGSLISNVNDYRRAVLHHGFQFIDRYATRTIGINRIRT